MAAPAKKAAPKKATAEEPPVVDETTEPVEHEHGDYSEYMNDAEPDFDAPEQNAKVTS